MRDQWSNPREQMARAARRASERLRAMDLDGKFAETVSRLRAALPRHTGWPFARRGAPYRAGEQRDRAQAGASDGGQGED